MNAARPIAPRTAGTRYHSKSCTSTNDLAKDAIRAGLATDRDYFTADTMTAGRATNGNTWHAPAGGLWLSVIIQSPPEPTHLWPAIAAANALEIAWSIPTQLKWPNDVLTRKTGKKIAGILIERVQTPTHSATILGIGINVAQTDFPAELKDTATSAAIEAPETSPTPNALLPILLQQLDATRQLDLIAAFQSRAPMTRGPITIHRKGKPPSHAIAEGLTDTGALRIRTPDNTLDTLTSAADLDVRPRSLAHHAPAPQPGTHA